MGRLVPQIGVWLGCSRDPVHRGIARTLDRECHGCGRQDRREEAGKWRDALSGVDMLQAIRMSLS